MRCDGTRLGGPPLNASSSGRIGMRASCLRSRCVLVLVSVAGIRGSRFDPDVLRSAAGKRRRHAGLSHVT